MASNDKSSVKKEKKKPNPTLYTAFAVILLATIPFVIIAAFTGTLQTSDGKILTLKESEIYIVSCIIVAPPSAVFLLKKAKALKLSAAAEHKQVRLQAALNELAERLPSFNDMKSRVSCGELCKGRKSEPKERQEGRAYLVAAIVFPDVIL